MTPTYPETADIKSLVDNARHIVIIQADNPDADSLGSALALEHILGDLGKEPYLYCRVHIPDHLRYLEGYDRVSDEMPDQFDLSIIVDTSADSLLEVTSADSGRQKLASKPCIIIDHHDTEPSISFSSVVCNQSAVATGEVIYELARQLEWPLSPSAGEMILASIMADSLGLTTEATTSRSIRIIAELVEKGANIPALEQKRRQLMRRSPEIVAYKGRLLERIQYDADGRLAFVVIPWEEIRSYSYQYNPSMLVIEDMRMVTGVAVAIAFKIYQDGKVTAKIRCNYGFGIAGKLAEQFGGGGHAYSSGFKITDDRSFEDIKTSCMAAAAELLDALQ